MGLAKHGVCTFAGAAVVIAIANLCHADDSIAKLEFFGQAAMQAGQFVNYKYRTAGFELDHQWLQDNILRIGLRTQFHPRCAGAVGIRGDLGYNAFPDSMLWDASRFRRATFVAFQFERAEMSLNLSPDAQESLLKVHIGIFPFKYNNDARNLGEYLFRTGCYPGFINSDGFDLPVAQLAGIRVSNDLFNCWHNEGFLTSEVYLYPMNDFSLTYLTDYTPLPNKVLNIGAALQLYHCFSVNKGYTQPEHYPQGNLGSHTVNYYFDKNDPLHKDTLFYSFAGSKIMARFSFDPKPLFGMNIFGPEDLKLYSEAIILGVKNYPANFDTISGLPANQPVNEFGYDKLMQKIPIMVGLNLPTFRLLDVLSVETEYYGKQYVNRVMVPAVGINMQRLPTPYDVEVNSGEPEGSNIAGASGTGLYSKDTFKGGAAQWKWSIYAKKTIFNNFSITAQAARDHSRVPTSIDAQIDQEECLIKDKQWYWMLKFEYNF